MRYPIILAMALLLAGCEEETPDLSIKSAEAARIEKEVAKRVEAAKLESSVRTSRLKTIRLIGFIALVGGSVGGLVWLRQSRFTTGHAPASETQRIQPPLWNDHYPPRQGRVLQLPAVTENRRQRHHTTNRRNHRHASPRHP